jgi:hypothetical protein
LEITLARHSFKITSNSLEGYQIVYDTFNWLESKSNSNLCWKELKEQIFVYGEMLSRRYLLRGWYAGSLVLNRLSSLSLSKRKHFTPAGHHSDHGGGVLLWRNAGP